MLTLGIFSLKQPELVSVSVAEVKKGYLSGRLLGSNVVNDRNERIGTITELVLGQDYALFAVLESDSFLGLDTHLIAVAIRAHVFEDTGRRVMLPADAKRCELSRIRVSRLIRTQHRQSKIGAALIKDVPGGMTQDILRPDDGVGPDGALNGRPPRTNPTKN